MVQENRARSNAALAALIVSNRMGCKPDEVLRAPSERFLMAQAMAIYVASVELRSSQEKVALAFDCSPSKVRYCIRKIEDRRDDDADFEADMQAVIDRACPMFGGKPATYV